MKKFLSIILILILCLGVFAACNENTETNETNESSSSDETETPTTPPEEGDPIEDDGIVKENTAYKLFIEQKTVGKTLYLTSEVDSKYIKTTENASDAPDFYAEKSGDGYMFYCTANGAKTYIKAWVEAAGEGKTSKYLGFGAEGTAFVYNETLKVWGIELDGETYYMGTYSDYETASISKSSYFTADTIRVTQFPVDFILSENAGSAGNGDNNDETDTPADPTEITSISDAIAIGNAKGHNEYTTEKYLVKGTITAFGDTASAMQYGNFYISDEDGNTIYVYGLYSADGETRFDKMNPQPKLGDTVTIKAIVGKFNSNPQFKDAWLIELVVLDPLACTHNYSSDCDTICNFCNAERTVNVEHTYDNACDPKCNTCGTSRTPSDHIYDNACDIDCNVCKAVRNPSAHVDADTNSVCDVCEKEIKAATGESLAVFEFGDNVPNPEKHNDGTDMKEDNATFTVNGHTLTITNFVKTYVNAYDAKGTSALKLGTSKAVGSFEFTVGTDVNSVVINVAKYKLKNSTIQINGTEYTISGESDNGVYDEIVIDTTITKKISITTVSGKTRCMIDSIEFKG